MELCVFSTAFYLGDLLRDLNRDLIFYISEGIWLPSLVFSGVMLLSSTGMGLYQRTRNISDMALLLRIFASFLLAWTILNLLFYLFPQLYQWRRIIVYALAVSMIGILASRFLFFKFAVVKYIQKYGKI
jgi:FlaA1/EpsC-like NDP-sugar epimerase